MFGQTVQSSPENFRTSGVETRHSSWFVFGLAEAMPLYQSPELSCFFSKL
jgi:hypothetical protein